MDFESRERAFCEGLRSNISFMNPDPRMIDRPIAETMHIESDDAKSIIKLIRFIGYLDCYSIFSHYNRLTLSVLGRCVDLVDHFLTLGADVNVSDGYNRPLSIAIYDFFKPLPLSQRLIDAGADVMPYIYTVANGGKHVISLLNRIYKNVPLLKLMLNSPTYDETKEIRVATGYARNPVDNVYDFVYESRTLLEWAQAGKFDREVNELIINHHNLRRMPALSAYARERAILNAQSAQNEKRKELSAGGKELSAENEAAIASAGREAYRETFSRHLGGLMHYLHRESTENELRRDPNVPTRLDPGLANLMVNEARLRREAREREATRREAAAGAADLAEASRAAGAARALEDARQRSAREHNRLQQCKSGSCAVMRRAKTRRRKGRRNTRRR